MHRKGLEVHVDVSRETSSRLEQYEALLRKWNAAINLVSKSTLADLWERHFLDSAQIFQYAPPARSWVDFGSGGGFPGLVVAILALEKAPELHTHLVESDGRKAAFLSATVRELGLNATVHAQRVEALPPLGADVASARALAPLAQLLDYAQLHLQPQGKALFLKGAAHVEEIADARRLWQFECKAHRSVTDPAGAILDIGGITRV